MRAELRRTTWEGGKKEVKLEREKGNGLEKQGSGGLSWNGQWSTPSVGNHMM
jgi:hypothetical protein